MSRSFFDSFPPPEFLSMKPVGISISSDAVRAINFSHHSSGARIASHFEKILPVDTIMDAEIHRTNDLLAVLREAKDATKARFANVSLPEEKSFIYEVALEVPEGGNIKDAVEFTLEENVPIAPAEAVFDFVVISEEKEESKEHVVVSVFPRILVESYLSLFAQIGIIPTAFYPESEAQALSVISRADHRTYVVLIISLSKIEIAIVKRGVVRFSSTLNLPAADSSLESSIKLVTIEAEVKKVCSYWQNTHRDKPSKIESIIITGETEGLDSLPGYLGEHIGISSKFADVWQNVFSLDEYVPDISQKNSLRYSGAIGTLLL